ncbi:MAG: hypothetical protein ABI699_08925 [Caldimonas sp.]
MSVLCNEAGNRDASDGDIGGRCQALGAEGLQTLQATRPQIGRAIGSTDPERAELALLHDDSGP